MAQAPQDEERDIVMKEGGSVPVERFDPTLGGVLTPEEVYESVLLCSEYDIRRVKMDKEAVVDIEMGNNDYIGGNYNFNGGGYLEYKDGAAREKEAEQRMKRESEKKHYQLDEKKEMGVVVDKSGLGKQDPDIVKIKNINAKKY